MGSTISARTGRTLDRLEHEQRDCRCGNGICRSRARFLLYYNRPESQPLRACLRHARITASARVSDHIGELRLERIEEY